MSLLNQVLHDLDRRMPPGERPPVRLAAAPTVARDAGDTGRRTGPDRWRVALWALVGLAVLASAWVYLAEPRPTPVITPRTAQVLALPPNPSARPAAAAPTAAPVTVARSDATPADNAAPSIVQPLPLPLPPPAVTQDAARPETADAAPPTAAGQTPDATVAPAAGETRELAADVSPATLPPRAGAQAGERAGLRPGNPSGHAADAGPAERVRYRPLRNVVEPPPLRGRHVVSASRAGDTAEVKTATPAPSDPLAAVRRAIDVGELAEAEALLEERLGRAPRDLEARELLLGLVLRGGRTDAALAQLALGLRDYPGHGSFILIRARLLAQAGDPEAAISVLESAPRSQTTRGERLQMLAALYQQQGRYGESAEAYRALLATAPGSGPAWAGLGVSLDAVGDPEAAAAYRRALELGGLPQAAEAYARDRLAQLGQGDG